eukprot:2138472-Prymnesium_polylepis.3
MPIRMSGRDLANAAQSVFSDASGTHVDYNDLPVQMKLMMVDLKKGMKFEGIDLERVFQVTSALLLPPAVPYNHQHRRPCLRPGCGRHALRNHWKGALRVGAPSRLSPLSIL